MKLPETRYARSGDVRIAYQVTGHGPLDLVFVPGFLSNLELHWEDPGYSHLLRRLAAFSRLIHFDKRGTGLSDRVDPANLPDLETRMDDVRAVMEAAGSGRAALFGASEGAPMAILFAATYPERTRALVLYGGYANFHKWVLGPEAVDRFVAEAERNWGTGASLKGFAPGRLSDPHFSAWWARFERLSCSPTAAIALARMNERIDLRGILGSIRVPTLVLHRRDDPRVDPAAGRYLAEHIEGARFAALAGRDHPPWTGDVDAVADAVEEFLTGMPPHVPHRRVLAALVALRLPGPGPHSVRTSDREWLDAVERFERTAGEIARRLGGTLLRRDGDSALLQFDGPARALRAAVELGAAARATDLLLAQGVHVGEVEVDGDPMAGTAPRTARAIAAAAAPGEILASALVAELSAGSGEHFAPRAAIAAEGYEQSLRLVRVITEQHLEPQRRRTAGAADLSRLSQREREVLDLVAEGLSNAAIAADLGLSEHTVKRHVANILDKLDLPTRVAAAAEVSRQPPS